MRPSPTKVPIMSSTASPPSKRRAPRKPAIRLPAKLREAEDIPGNRHWRAYFLAHLVETSNVTAAAKAAGVVPSRAYRTRHEDPDFAAQWRSALAQGYENLEMELLGHLRSPDAERKIDIANAIRLLSLHCETAARERAAADNRNEQEVLDSIDAMIDEMRERAQANAALLARQREAPDEGK